jgi:hypothetical protein
VFVRDEQDAQLTVTAPVSDIAGLAGVPAG